MKKYKDEKMCALVKKEVQSKHPGDFGAIIGKANYFCKKCGRASDSKKMVCKPEKRKSK